MNSLSKTVTHVEPATLEGRNVIDYYKRWQHDEIVADLDKKRNPFINVCLNLTGDFSKSSIIRNANAWLAKETWIIGRKRFDARGTVGTHHYETIKHSATWEDVFLNFKAEGYTIYAVDNIPEYDPKVIYNVSYPAKSVFVYGEEGVGLPEDVIQACDSMIYIPQYGSVRSINVAVAAGVVMNEWTRQHNPQIQLD
jgi:tRNA G18 (ribose-2'-O)-methylase SpoU